MYPDGRRHEYLPQKNTNIQAEVIRNLLMIPVDAQFSVCYNHGSNIYGEPNAVDIYVRMNGA